MDTKVAGLKDLKMKSGAAYSIVFIIQNLREYILAENAVRALELKVELESRITPELSQ